ncbi:MAG TPA: pyridoxamine 5'-phosphate oxidase family protein [Gemmatimonadales bacterium]|nr:pyridoxamine 5'-phosphate oxidase family protein [Gemmatimonadales bacterium]
MLGALSDDAIERLLRSEVVGRIGCSIDGRAYVVPVTYAYDGHAIYGHSGEGMKVRMMRQNPVVCFEVDHMDDMVNWRSVIVWGRFEELRGTAAAHAMGVLMDRLLPLTPSETAALPHDLQPSEVHRADVAGRPVVVYRIVVEEKTGRFEKR